jgi:hypothetical protein
LKRQASRPESWKMEVSDPFWNAVKVDTTPNGTCCSSSSPPIRPICISIDLSHYSRREIRNVSSTRNLSPVVHQPDRSAIRNRGWALYIFQFSPEFGTWGIRICPSLGTHFRKMLKLTNKVVTALNSGTVRIKVLNFGFGWRS